MKSTYVAQSAWQLKTNFKNEELQLLGEIRYWEKCESLASAEELEEIGNIITGLWEDYSNIK